MTEQARWPIFDENRAPTVHGFKGDCGHGGGDRPTGLGGLPDTGLAMTVEAFAAGVAAVARADDERLAELIARIVLHDERALTELYDATVRRVHSVVRRFTPDAGLAEEVVEDTYWQVWRQAPRFDAARGRPLSWLFTMARSRALDALRRNHRFAPGAFDAAGQQAEHAPAEPGHGPPERLAAAHEVRRLHDALARLGPRERELLVLAFFGGLTHGEIAKHTALPLGTVKTRIRRSLLVLRNRLDDRTADRGTTV